MRKSGLLLCCLCGIVLFSTLIPPSALAAETGQQYTYRRSDTQWVEAVPIPDVFSFETRITGHRIGAGAFKAPRDLYVTKDKIYILDSGNNRIVITDRNFKLYDIITDFTLNGEEQTFNAPGGIFVADNGDIYIADTKNKRVVVLDENIEVKLILTLPESDLIRDNTEFNPIRVATDGTGSIYVVSQGFFEGLFEFNIDGGFVGFFGAAKAKYSVWELLWKRIMPEEASSRMVKFVPVEYVSADIDSKGFIYATSSTQDISESVISSYTPIKRLAPDGIDVLKRLGLTYPVGDVPGSYRNQPSTFSDISVMSSDFYAALDSTGNRLFVYDYEGNMVVSFGGTGTVNGTFQKATAVDNYGMSLFVLDETGASVDIFTLSQYGNAIIQATQMYRQGNYGGSKMNWQYVLDQSLYNEMAYAGLGRVAMREKEYSLAMNYFKLADNRMQYSEALVKYRQSFLEQYFLWIIIPLIAVIAGVVILLRMLGRLSRREGGGTTVQMAYTLQVCTHPFKSFWDIRFYNRVGVRAGTFLILLFILLRVTSSLYGGFIFTGNGLTTLNVLRDFLLFFFAFLLLCASNWITSMLLDGFGRFKDIYVCTACCLTPLIIGEAFYLAASWVFSLEEMFILMIVRTLSVALAVFLYFCFNAIFFGGAFKAVCGMLLTVFITMVIMFVSIIFVSMAQQIISFLSMLYTESQLL